MKYKSACGTLIQMHYGMFDDDRLKHKSCFGISFLQIIEEHKQVIDYFKKIYVTSAPKFESRIGEIV